MNDQFSSTPVQPADSQSPTIKLWTPRLIGAVTFFLGFPAGIVLASMNWVRMNSKDKALIHLIAGAAGAFVFLLLILLIPGNNGKIISLLANLGMIYYLQKQTENDVSEFKATGADVQNAQWFGGCLIGVVVGGLFLAFAFVLVFFLALIGVPIPE